MTSASQTKNRALALLLPAALADGALLPGCLLAMDSLFLEEGSPENLSLPDATGRWTGKHGVYEVSATNMTNTFIIGTKDDPKWMTATFERMSPTRLLARLKPDAENEEWRAALGVIEWTPEKVRHYDFSSAYEEEIRAKAAASGVTFDEQEKHTKYESREGLIKLLSELAAAPGAACVTLAKENTP